MTTQDEINQTFVELREIAATAIPDTDGRDLALLVVNAVYFLVSDMHRIADTLEQLLITHKEIAQQTDPT
jgi:hypothetical protein